MLSHQPAPYYPPQLNRGDAGFTTISAAGWNTGRSSGDTRPLWCYWLSLGGVGAFLYTLYQTPV